MIVEGAIIIIKAIWWQVDFDDSGTDGWVRERDLIREADAPPSLTALRWSAKQGLMDGRPLTEAEARAVTS